MSGYLAKTRRMSAGNVPDMGIALVLSALLHLFGASLAYWWHSSPPELYGRAQDLEIDVSFIPLSSLATNIPPSAPPTEKKDLSPQPEPIPAEPAPRRDPPPENVVSLAPRRKEEAPAPKVNKLPQQQDQMPVKPLAHYESRARLGLPSGTGDPTEQARISYQDLIATRIAKAKRYPEGALRRHTTGSGVVRVTIVSSGQVDGFELVQSTDSPILDEELQDMVERASPFPPFPEDLKRDSIAIVLPVAFQLNP